MRSHDYKAGALFAALLAATPAFSQTSKLEIPFQSGDVKLAHAIQGKVLGDFEGHEQSAEVEATASSSLSLFDGEVSAKLCSAHAVAYGYKTGNLSYGFSCDLQVLDETEDVHTRSYFGAGSVGGFMTGENTLHIVSRGVGQYEFRFALVHVLLNFTAIDVEAGIQVNTYGNSTTPSASLNGRLRARPNEVKMTGSLAWAYSEPTYDEGGNYCWAWVEAGAPRTPENLRLGELRTRGQLKSSPLQSYGTINYHHGPVQLHATVSVDYWWNEMCFAQGAPLFGSGTGLDSYGFSTYSANLANNDWTGDSGVLRIR